MPLSFLKRLLERKRSSTNEASLSGIMPREVLSSRISPQTPHLEPVAKSKYLFAFVDLKDPFVPSGVEGEELLGPILSALSARRFDAVFLFHTLQTQGNAVATLDEVARRHPQTAIRQRIEMPDCDSKNYPSLARGLFDSLQRHHLLGLPDEDEKYLCISSGTAEMRAAWISLTTQGILKATLLEVKTPANPLFGRVKINELKLDTAGHNTIRDIAFTKEDFLTMPTAALEAADIVLTAKSEKREDACKSDWEIFEEEFVERMRKRFGEARTAALLPVFQEFIKWGFYGALRSHLRQPGLRDTRIPLEKIREWAGLHFEKLFGSSQRRLGALVTSMGKTAGSPRDEILPNDDSSYPSDLSSDPQEILRDVAQEPKSSSQRLGAFSRTKRPAEDRTVQKVPLQALLNETPVEGVSKEAEEGVEVLPVLPTEIRNLTTASVTGTEIKPANLAVPGLDEALLELGIHVGSAVLRLAAEQAGIAADWNVPVLIVGETGTGKEQFAHLIHRLSPRSSKTMLAINCAAIPAPLAESYLFGHVKGAFSDATSDRAGIFETADSGTLFLDEIAELTLEVQAKLLRVIQDGMIQRLGSTSTKKVDVRIIAASNRDLTKEISVRRFREDLYFRLDGVTIKLPALRDRQGEIPELALALLRQINQRIRKPRQLTKEALKRLECYSWPGNVRELSNVLQRSVLYSREDSLAIDADDLKFSDNGPATDFSVALPKLGEGFSIEEFFASLRKELFELALKKSNGNQAQAAALLGVSKQAVNKFVNDQSGNGS